MNILGLNMGRVLRGLIARHSEWGLPPFAVLLQLEDVRCKQRL